MANPCYARKVWGGVHCPSQSTEVITFYCKSASWLLTLSIWTVDPFYIDCQSAPPPDQQRRLPFHAKVKVECWSSLHQSSILLPWINRAIAFSCESESWLLTLSTLTVDPLHNDCWPSVHWLLTLSILLVDCWPSLHWLLILSTLTVDPLHIDCWPSLPWLLTLFTLTVDCWPSLYWAFILSALTVDCWLSLHWLLTLSALTVDCWPSLHWLSISPRINSVGPLHISHWSTPGWHCWSTPRINSVDPLHINHWFTQVDTVNWPPYRFQLCNL